MSFLISEEMNLYEQQSSYNPNMPVRMLQYAGNLYEKYIKQGRLNKFGRKRLSLPAPRLVVFYNGMEDQPEEGQLKLSDSFPGGAAFDIEVKVRMINVNMGKSQRILSACKPLGEYSWLVSEIRKNNYSKDEDGMSSAVDRAITDMPDDFLIKPFLIAHRAEVKGMLLTEYNEAEQMELFREEGREEGRVEGAESERINNIRSMMEMLKLSARQAMDVLKIPASEQPRYLSML